MPQSFYAFLYPTVVSKGAQEAAALASTHLETNISHLIPPREPGNSAGASAVQLQLCDFQRNGVLRQISKGCGCLERGAGSPGQVKLLRWSTSSSPFQSLFFLSSSLSFSALSCLSFFLAVFSGLTPLCFHVLQSGLQKTAVVFSPL